MLSESNAALPVGCDSPLQILMAVFFVLFVWIQTFWVRCDSPLLTAMVRQKAITIYRGLSHPTRSLSRIVCRGQECPKGRKGTLRPDFQAKTRPRFFFRVNITTTRLFWWNPEIVSLRKFRDVEVWLQLGQESPLMNKKGLKENRTAPSMKDPK